MSGKIFVVAILLGAAVFGGTMYYMQVYGYYREVAPRPGGGDVMLVSAATGAPVPIAHDGFRAIDADTSPIRYRACFVTAQDPQDLARTHVAADRPVPLVAPGWFECFDAREIGAGIAAGTIRAFLSGRNVAYGVDRVVAIAPDGRGWVWHQLNDCGEKTYDGTPVGADCPPRAPEAGR